ncbi:hypothetical protein M8C17_02170 [Micromonospora sp. RHAY321]|uniref:hypothetical protein n=1 Tax=Micromonospora sp. RHAY321 TaxID=2944807 RepID=UPI00207C8C99|nr:hypothetical protein [Micromonospora sp. RHAY321]MCO1593961.1 hypothetical protein [Micromonospora sp. RHAY321]
MTAADHEGTRPSVPPSQPPRAEGSSQPVPAQPAPPPYFTTPPAPGGAAMAASPNGLSSPLPHIMAGAGFLAMMVAMFAPLASNGDPVSALRTTDLPFLTPMLGLVALVVATAVLCGNPRLLRLGRAAAPLLGLLLSAAVGGEIVQWGAKAANPELGLADMVASGTYFLIGGILLLSLSVLSMRPAGHASRFAG